MCRSNAFRHLDPLPELCEVKRTALFGKKYIYFGYIDRYNIRYQFKWANYINF